MGSDNPANYEIMEPEGHAASVSGTSASGNGAGHDAPSLILSGTNLGAFAHNGSLDRNKSYRSPVQAEGPASRRDGNLLMTQPDIQVPTTEGHELDSFLGRAFEEKPIWTDLYESLRDV